MRRLLRLGALVAVLGLIASAQQPQRSTNHSHSEPTFDVLALDTGPGSFRAEGEGEIVIDMTPNGVGTVYVSGLKGPNSRLTVEGLRKEYEARGRVCFHGTGKVTVRGKFRAVNWMGNRMRGSFTGRGMIRLYGDLDKNLRTGLVYYPGFRDEKGQQIVENWETFGREFHVPKPKDYTPRPRETGPPRMLED